VGKGLSGILAKRASVALWLAATLVLALPLDEISVKVADGPPDDEDDDISRPIWAGVVPLRESFGEPIPAPDLVEPYPVPDYVKGWRRPTS